MYRCSVEYRDDYVSNHLSKIYRIRYQIMYHMHYVSNFYSDAARYHATLKRYEPKTFAVYTQISH
jgi:hypothetical protein